MRKLTHPRKQIGWKAWLGIGLVGPLVAGVALIPSNASGDVEPGDHGDHEHAAMTAGLQDDLARVRAATGFEPYPVPQRDRDLLFARCRLDPLHA